MGLLIDKDGSLHLDRLIVGIILLVFALVTISGTIAIVPAGYRGVVLQFGAVENRVLNEGLHFITPYVESYKPMEVRTMKYEVDCDSASKDLLDVKTRVAINYHLDPANVNKVYQTLGENYQDRIIAPQVQEVVKAVTAKFDAEGLVQTRELAKNEIDKLLTERMLNRSIFVETISITNFEFPHEFMSSVTAKQTQVQKAMEAENKVKEAEALAKQKIAEATGTAESIRLINEQLKRSPDYLKLKSIEKWDGKLPVFMGGNSLTPFISLNELANMNSTGG